MDKINDGGPAFPPHWDPKTHPSGMSLRDYFAAKAMQGDWAAQVVPDSDDDLFDRSARMYYRMADAMLAAREKQP